MSISGYQFARDCRADRSAIWDPGTLGVGSGGFWFEVGEPGVWGPPSPGFGSEDWRSGVGDPPVRGPGTPGLRFGNSQSGIGELLVRGPGTPGLRSGNSRSGSGELLVWGPGTRGGGRRGRELRAGMSFPSRPTWRRAERSSSHRDSATASGARTARGCGRSWACRPLFRGGLPWPASQEFQTARDSVIS